MIIWQMIPIVLVFQGFSRSRPVLFINTTSCLFSGWLQVSVRFSPPKAQSKKSIRPMITVIVPVMNEAENLEPLLEEIDRAAKTVPISEIIYVDDGSDDGSFEILTWSEALAGVAEPEASLEAQAA